MKKKKRIGVYVSASQLLKNPVYLEKLRDEIDLSLAVIYFNGEAPPDLVRHSPFDSSPPSDSCLESLLSRHLDGRCLETSEFDQARGCVGPSVSAAGDDTALRQAVAIARHAGLEVWLCAGAWTGSHLMYCPGNEAVQDWYAAYFAHCATEYDADGLDVTHARFPRASVPRGLFACTCSNCAARAEGLGYEMEAMLQGLQVGQRRLQSLDAGLLARLSWTGAGLFDYLHLMGLAGGVVDWFLFRSELLSTQIARFREAVRERAGADFCFGADTYPASLAPLIGHNITTWDLHSDFASPLVSHISSFVADGLVAWARWLEEETNGLGEADALQTVYRFAGYDGMGMPETVAGYQLDQPGRLPYVLPLEELILRDLRKTRLLLPPAMPSYPVIHGSGWPREAIDAIVAGADEIGHDGIVWQGTDELMPFDLQ